MNELIPLTNADGIVMAVDDAYRNIYAGLEMIEKAKLRLENTLGQYGGDFFSDYHQNQLIEKGWRERAYNEIKKRIKANTWAYIVDKIQLKMVLSNKRIDEINNQLKLENASTLPELTEDNIFSFINSNLGNATNYVEEALQEVFDLLRPNKDYHPFKTNKKFEIGPKVIFDWYMDTNYSVSVNYYRQNNLRAIDKLFHLIDGKAAPKYPEDIVTVINNACRQRQWDAETPYFKMKWFKKGTLHIEFKRLDLVAAINKKAGGMRLKGGEES